MTAATTTTTTRTHGTMAPPMTASRGRVLVAIVLLVSLVAMAGMRAAVQRRHDRIVPKSRGGSRLSQMNTFALGLVLGGLRGPLVMFLWTSSENQKTDRDLQDIDTKIELIRMLQPEFDSVHIFQIWNKAYNISVQMANFQNKYTTILDALDYARSVDEERPDNINILMSMGEVYYQKLGQSNPEKVFYIPRLKQDTLPKATPERLKRGQTGWRRTRHDTMLDERGMLLPEYTTPDPGMEGKPYDGSELQLLREYSTPEKRGFPYGISPIALGYNYYRRAGLLQETTGQRHLNMSESVVSSRSAVALRDWAASEWWHGRALEITAAGKPVPPGIDQWARELPTASETLAFKDASDETRRMVLEAMFSYWRGADVAAHTERDYRRHIAVEEEAEIGVYGSQVDNALAMQALLEGDYYFLAAAAVDAGFKPPLVGDETASSLRRKAAAAYAKAIDRYYLLTLKYYVQDDAAAAAYKQVAGQAIDKTNVQKADPKLYPAMLDAVLKYHAAKGSPNAHGEDITEYTTYIRRARERIQQIQ
jgi:hypothetical protein